MRQRRLSLLDRVITVSNNQVGHAMRLLWESLRCVSEPSGAMGVAAAWKLRGEIAGKKVLTILCGANIDFLQLGLIAQSDGASGRDLLLNPPQAGPPLNTFGYPYAEVGGKPLDFYDPKSFVYHFSFKEL